jgi:hypothetical protein
MPAWGDRMTDAEIQAIVGFLRQWEATAPEVAQPMGPPSGVGGPPWLRNQNTTDPAGPAIAPELSPTQVPDTGAIEPPAQATAIAEHQATEIIGGGQAGPPLSEQDMATHMAQEAATGGGGQGQGQGGPPWMEEQVQTSEFEAFDLRVLALIAGGLSVAFTLMAIGFSSLKRLRSHD